MHVYVAYDKKWPYLPIAIGDTAKELAEQLGGTSSTVYCAVNKNRNSIKKVYIDDEREQ